jgi:hypothetical protein
MLKSLISNSRRRQFFNLLIFYLIYLWTRGFSTAVLPVYFLKENLSLEQIIFGNVATFSGATILLLLMRKFTAKLSWRLAMVFGFIYILLIVRINSPAQFYLASILSGLTIIFYFIPYNIAHFQTTPPHRTGISSAALFIFPTLIGLITPLAAGVAGQTNFNYLWIISGIFYLLCFYLVRYQQDFIIDYRFFKFLDSIKTTKVLIFLQALWESMIFGIIPVFSLLFITEPLKFGIYLTYLSAVGIAANLFLGHLTDRLKKRAVFLYPVTILMGVFTLIFPWGLTSIKWWIVITGIVQFLTPIFWNLSTALVVDTQTDLKQAFVAREGILMIGRAIALALVYLNFQFQSPPTLIFYFLGGVMLLYPLVLVYNTSHAARS